MKAMIFAAGRGERLRPLTDATPKPLLEVGGRALIEHHLQKLRDAGIRDVVINTAWLAEQFPQRLGDGSRYGLSIVYSYEGHLGLETGGGLLNALPLLGDAPFLLVNGDVHTDIDFASLPERPDGLAHLAMVETPAGKPSDFAWADDGKLHAEPDPGLGKPLTYSGIAVIDPKLFAHWREAFAPAECQGRPPAFRLAPLLRHAMRHGLVDGRLHAGHWADAGTPEALEALRRAAN